MASPIITPIPVQTDTEYRPISRLAVAGLLLALPSVFLFASPNLSWMFFVFVLPAILVSVLALRSIQRADGAMAGEAVARMGIVLAVAGGLGWVTSEVVTKYITELEARSTADAWIENMRRGEAGAAFLMTTQPKQRNITFHPEEYAKLRKQFPAAQQASQFDNFLADPAYGQLLRYGQEAKIEYLGTVEFQSRFGSITYNFKYHLTTPEADGDLIVSIRSEDVQSDQGIRREWILGYDQSASRMRWTKLGDEIQYASAKVVETVDALMNHIVNDHQDDLAKMIPKEPARRGEFDQVYGYLSNKSEGGGVTFLAVMKPIRLRSAQKENGTWRLKFDCTALAVPERVVEFSFDALADQADRSKWNLENFRFVGTRRVLAPEDDPNGPKPLRRQTFGAGS